MVVSSGYVAARILKFVTVERHHPKGRANFWPPVSASKKNAVPDTWISRGKGPFRGLEIGDSGRQKCRFCSDEIGCQERERNRHIDLTHTAFLAYRDLLDANHRARRDLVKPATASGK